MCAWTNGYGNPPDEIGMPQYVDVFSPLFLSMFDSYIFRLNSLKILHFSIRRSDVLSPPCATPIHALQELPEHLWRVPTAFSSVVNLTYIQIFLGDLKIRVADLTCYQESCTPERMIRDS